MQLVNSPPDVSRSHRSPSRGTSRDCRCGKASGPKNRARGGQSVVPGRGRKRGKCPKFEGFGLRAVHGDPTLTFSGTSVARSAAGVRSSLPGLLLSSLVAISAVAAARLLDGGPDVAVVTKRLSGKGLA
jgi:hypothetical protein